MFSRMSFKAQLSVPFVTTVVGLLVIAGIFFFSSRLYNGAIDQMEVLRAIDVKLTKIERNLLTARKLETDYIFNRSPGLVEKRKEVIVDAIAILGSLIEEITTPENQQKLIELKDHVVAYDESFDTLVKQIKVVGETEKDGLQGLLRRSVHGVEELLKELLKEHSSDKMAITMLMMRRHEKDFLLRFDPKYIGQMDERHKEFKALIEKANLPYDVGVVVSQRMNGYVRGFKLMANGWLKLHEDIKLLDAAFDQLTVSLGEKLAYLMELEDQVVKVTKSKTAQASTVTIIALIVIGIAMVLFTLMIMKTLSGLISRMTRAMNTLAEGDLDTEVPSVERKDIIGAMAVAVNVFKTNSIENRRLSEENEKAREEQARHEAEELARQRETERAEAERMEREREAEARKAAEMNALITEFDQQVQQAMSVLESVSSEMMGASDLMENLAEQNGSLAETVDGRCASMSQNVGAVASATEELSASIREISHQVQQSAAASTTAVGSAEEGVGHARNLETAGQKIETVVDLIQDIANQTNLLALNATIEAARAGEAGKGFAVVASEVKSLANQTSKATEEISQQIQEMQSVTASVVEVLDQISKQINSNNDITTGISAAVEEQSAATGEISGSVQQAANAANDVSGSVEQIRKGVEESRASSSNVRSISEEMRRATGSFKDQIDSFLTRVKSVG